MTEQRHGGPTPADYLAEMLQRRGIVVDMQRLQDRVAAVQERRKAKDDDHLDRVRALASAVWRARRDCEAGERFWRLESTQGTLADAMAAQHGRTDAEQALREALLGDDALMARVLYETR